MKNEDLKKFLAGTTPKFHTIGVRLIEEDFLRLKKLTKEYKATQSNVIRALIRMAAEENQNDQR